MYVKLYHHRDEFVVIDDVDALYADRSGVRLLKCLCQTEEEKAVAWHSDARSLERQLRLGHRRWLIERLHQDAKQELGLGDYQGRMWPGLHRHLALVSLIWCYVVWASTSATDEVSGAFPPSTEPAGGAASGAGGAGSDGHVPGLPQSHRAADAGLPPPRPLTFRG